MKCRRCNYNTTKKCGVLLDPGSVAEDAPAVGTAIIDARKRRGLSQADLARALDVSQQSVSKWEAGAVLPRPRTLARLAEILRVSVDDLLAGGVDRHHDEFADDVEGEDQDHDVMDDVTINFNAPPDQVPPEALDAIKTLLRPYFEK